MIAHMSKRKVIRSAIILMIAMASGLWLRHELNIDSCLDRGGAWRHDRALCEGAR